MIVKHYKLYCDKCGRKISSWETTSIKKAVSLEKKALNGTKITKRLNGAYHIECADCVWRASGEVSF